MAVIQPHEVAGLPELFDEVKALRQELELLRTGMRSEPPLDPRHAEPQRVAALAREAEDDLESAPLAPEEIRERVGRIVGERPQEPQPGATPAQLRNEP